MLSRSASAAAAAAAAVVRRASASASASAASAGTRTYTTTTCISSSGGLLRRPRTIPAALASTQVQTASMRRFSSASTSASAGVSIPTRHSRHLPRPVCADAAELEATTASLLASRPGSLFTYEHGGGGAIGSLGGSSNKADEYEAGLARSDVTTQKFEWTLGGHAAAIPGTVANASAAACIAASGDASSASSYSLSKSKKHLDAMVELLERIEEEGRIYVELRARVLNQQFGSGGVSSASSSSSDSSSDSGSSSSSDSDNETSTGAAKSQSAWRIQSLINRYGAAPGPSIYMYDALLDAIACCAERQQQQQHHHHQQQEQDDSSADMSMEYLALARSVYERAMARHYADGGPNANNRLTVPTLVTYNAVLRTCAAAVEYNSNNNALRVQVQLRDAALDLAFVVYDALNANSPTDPASTSNAVSKNKSSKKVAGNNTSITTTTSTCTTSSAAILPKRNSATYAHMLRVIARCIPPSPTRGNVAYGLWLSCTGHDGVLDGQVIQAFVEANTRNGSNGQQYDAFVAKVRGAGAGTGAGIDSPQENDVLRQNWWRNRNSRRIQQSIGGGGEGMSEY